MTEQAPAYAVTSVQDTMAYDAQHGMVRHKRINVRMADGTQTYVEVPLANFNAEHVQRELQKAADAHAEVLSIQGPMVNNPTVTGQFKASQGG